MRITIRSGFAKLLLMFVELAVFFFMIGWVGKVYFADVLARTPTVNNLERALKLDPANTGFHVQLGRLYEYDPVAVQPEKAEAHFRRATQIAPDDPQTWLELAAALEFQGNDGRSEGLPNPGGCPRAESTGLSMANCELLPVAGQYRGGFPAFSGCACRHLGL